MMGIFYGAKSANVSEITIINSPFDKALFILIFMLVA